MSHRFLASVPLCWETRLLSTDLHSMRFMLLRQHSAHRSDRCMRWCLRNNGAWILSWSSEMGGETRGMLGLGLGPGKYCRDLSYPEEANSSIVVVDDRAQQTEQYPFPLAPYMKAEALRQTRTAGPRLHNAIRQLKISKATPYPSVPDRSSRPQLRGRRSPRRRPQ
jgi:hypothetical protein